jgi:hypothetical protein
MFKEIQEQVYASVTVTFVMIGYSVDCCRYYSPVRKVPTAIKSR